MKITATGNTCALKTQKYSYLHTFTRTPGEPYGGFTQFYVGGTSIWFALDAYDGSTHMELGKTSIWFALGACECE